MVAGFTEDIESEDESATPVITNHINEAVNNREHFRTPKKPTAAVTVEITSSEDEEEEQEDDDEEEKRIEREKREKREKEEERIKAKRKVESETLKLKLEMPVKSLRTPEPAVDGVGLESEDVDDWLNSPDSDPKVQSQQVFRVDNCLVSSYNPYVILIPCQADR